MQPIEVSYRLVAVHRLLSYCSKKGVTMFGWLNQCGDRELFWVLISLFGLFVFGLNV